MFGMKRTHAILLSASLLTTSAVAAAQLGGGRSDLLTSTESGRTFSGVLQLLKTHYLHDFDAEKVMRGAIHGALGALGDEFTYYEEPADNAIDAENLTGHFYGIGVVLENRQGGHGVRVGTVYQGGAAFDAGVQMGDSFVKVGDTDVRSATTSEVVRLVRGKENEPVTITFSRNGKPYTVTMKRREVPNISVESLMLPDKVGYIALSSFYNQKAAEQFAAAVADMKAKGATTIILDMRDNGGGLLDAGVQVADVFMDKGPVVSLQQKTGDAKLYGSATDQSSDFKGRVIVLVNRNSASASEVVSGALQDVGRATIIGEKTFGKGVAQIPFDTPDGGRVAVVNSEWVSPSGRHIHKKGILPDILVKDTRFPVPLNFMGSGVEPGTEVQMIVNGQTVTAKANAQGQFEYVGEINRQNRSSVRGEATVDLERDAQLRAALEYIKTGKVSDQLRMSKEQEDAERKAHKNGHPVGAEDAAGEETNGN